MADLDFLVQICEAATDTDILVLDIENPARKTGRRRSCVGVFAHLQPVCHDPDHQILLGQAARWGVGDD